MIRIISAGAAAAAFVLTSLALGVAIAEADWTAVAILPACVLFTGRYLVCSLVPAAAEAMDRRVATSDCMRAASFRVQRTRVPHRISP